MHAPDSNFLNFVPVYFIPKFMAVFVNVIVVQLGSYDLACLCCFSIQVAYSKLQVSCTGQITFYRFVVHIKLFVRFLLLEFSRKLLTTRILASCSINLETTSVSSLTH